ncbi:MAG TPA: hypothetical protein DEP84_03365 [Chloroflexi bacterium]|nr:hypothetical protein [Chloroflexota bacterium]
MAASFVAAGHALLSDDVLPLQVREDGVWVLPGPALLRLWPDSAARVWDDPATLRRHALQTPKRQVWLPMTERFYCGKPLPLRAVYLLERAEESIVRLEPLSQREALLALISSAFGNFLLRGELLSRQMDFFAQIVPTLPFRRLPVPAAFKGLATLYDAVLEDVATTGYRRDGNP